jgi:ligand-binding sensor domain-containing protein
VFGGRLYAGTKAGLRCWNGNRFVSTPPGFLADEYILNLQVDRNRLWISTLRQGVVAFDGRQTVRYDVAHGLSCDTAWSVALAGNDVWIGTERGLCRVGPGGGVTRFGRQDGLCCDQIRALWFDTASQTLWVATANGLSQFRGGRWRSFAREQGLTSPHVSSLLPVGDELWLGTEQGLFVVKNERIRRGFSRSTGLLGGEECSGVASIVRDQSGLLWYLSTSGATAIDLSIGRRPGGGGGGGGPGTCGRAADQPKNTLTHPNFFIVS